MTRNANTARSGGVFGFVWMARITTVTLAASGTLPMGLMFDPMSGTLSGTPAMAGPATVTLTATDAASKMVMKTFMFTITAPLVFNPSALPDGNVEKLP